MFRKHGRMAIRCSMLLKHKTLGVFEGLTRDISASGVFIGGHPPVEGHVLNEISIGDIMIARVEDFDRGSTHVRLKVARLTADGFALMFI